MRDRQIEIGVYKVLESFRNRIINDVTTRIIMGKKREESKTLVVLVFWIPFVLGQHSCCDVTEGQFESEFDRVWGDFMARVAIQ